MKRVVTKLPQWAQYLIKQLEERVKFWEEIAEGRGSR